MTRRVVLAGVIVVCLTALIAGGITYLRFTSDLLRSTDTSLQTLAARPRVLIQSRIALAQISSPAGGAPLESTSLAALGSLDVDRPGFVTVTIDGERLRVFSRRLADGRLFSVATSLRTNATDLARLRRDIVIGTIVGALIASIVLVIITRRALRPVRDTATVADRITSTNDLAARVPEPGGTDEIARLTHSINRMLAHLEASDAALRRLVADASHELRTPVTSLRGNLEMLTDGTPLSAGDRAAALTDARAETAHLQELVEALLTLARADAATAAEPVVLAELLSAAARDVDAGPDAPPATDAPAAVVTVSPAARTATVLGDPVALHGLVRNLIENAERYGGGAELALDRAGDELVLRVIDHGPGVPPAEREAVFGRFTRGSAGAGTPGSGLGLAIVTATARRHGGRVELGETPGGGATFTVRLPSSR